MAMPVRGDPDCKGDGIQWALEGSVGTRGVVWRVGPDSCGSGHIIVAPIHPGAASGPMFAHVRDETRNASPAKALIER